MPARNKNRLRNKRRDKQTISKTKKRWFLVFLCVVLAVALLVWVSSFRVSNWDGQTKFTLLVNREESVHILIFDPSSSSITDIVIPPDLEINVARKLGVWRLSSVWKLGQNEGVETLLTETVTRSLKFPVLYWASEDAGGFAGSGAVGILKASLASYDTNLTKRDKIKLGIFSFLTGSSRKNRINLANTQFIKKGQLSDGSSGYLLSGVRSAGTYSYFADGHISKYQKKIVIKTSTANSTAAEKTGEIIEVLGAKVAIVLSEGTEFDDCAVRGGDDYTVNLIAQLFYCEIENGGSGMEDTELMIGNVFSERF
jgi:hypothetical protein